MQIYLVGGAVRDGLLGLPVNERFELGRDQIVACDPIEVFHIPDDADPQELKERLIALHAAGQEERRERFIVALSSWLGSALTAG